jgi:hypothetical protein
MTITRSYWRNHKSLPSSSTCKTSIRAQTKGTMWNVGVELRERVCYKINKTLQHNYLKHQGWENFKHKRTTSLWSNMLCTKASIHKLTHSFRLTTQPSLFSQSLKQFNCLPLQTPKHHCPMTIGALGFSKCLESCDHKFWNICWVANLDHTPLMNGKQHKFA